jgi:two-component system OmpR family response regulator
MLVEDDERLAQLVLEYLNAYEFSVDLVTRGDMAIEHFQLTKPDIVILDLMLPGLDGMVVCRRIRELSPIPILILTAREDSYDEVSALEQGADDFVTKPVQPRILLARLRSLVRRVLPQDRANKNEHEQRLIFGQLQIALSDRLVFFKNQLIEMTNTEYKLLLVLSESAGKVLSRDDILMRLRGIEFDGLDRSIDNLISRLRRRFDDVKAEKIKTVWGEGYLFSPSSWEV